MTGRLTRFSPLRCPSPPGRSLDAATIQELGEGLAWLTQHQAEIAPRYEQVIREQDATIARQSATIEMQAATIERLSRALATLRPGVVLLDEGDAP